MIPPPQVVPNFSLKSLVGSWAERHRISDLPQFKGVMRQRTLARGPAGAADALAGLTLGPDAPGPAGPASPSGRPARLYPSLSGLREEDGEGGSGAAEPAPASPQQLADAAAAASGGVHPPPGVYPSMQPGTSPPGSRMEQAEAALGALRDAAAPGGGGGGNRGAMAYHAWSLLQLAGDAEGRRLLYEARSTLLPLLHQILISACILLPASWAKCLPTFFGCHPAAAPHLPAYRLVPLFQPASRLLPCRTAGQRHPSSHLPPRADTAAGGLAAGRRQARAVRHAAAPGRPLPR